MMLAGLIATSSQSSWLSGVPATFLPPTPWLWSHLSCALLIAVAIVAVAARRSWGQRRWVLPVAVVCGCLLSCLPVGEVDLAGQLLAYSGELSFVTVFYLGACVLAAAPGGRWRLEDRHWDLPRLFWAVAGLLLYTSALSGRGPDLYAWGFGTALLWPVWGAAAVLACGRRWLAAVLVLGVLWAWQLQLSGGVNFWDYAIDPFIFVGSFAQVFWSLCRRAASLSGISGGRQRKLTVQPGA